MVVIHKTRLCVESVEIIGATTSITAALKRAKIYVRGLGSSGAVIMLSEFKGVKLRRTIMLRSLLDINIQLKLKKEKQDVN